MTAVMISDGALLRGCMPPLLHHPGRNWMVTEDHKALCICKQDFQPGVIITSAHWPTGAYVADRLNIPKVSFSVIPPLGSAVNIPSAQAAWPSLGPVVPHWLPQPMVGMFLVFVSCISEMCCDSGS